ncbi:MAG: hypothetical protein J6V66_02945, partial [Clostridia bacterium]|nr:hypothetical protein [Clostridia bacterium]
MKEIVIEILNDEKIPVKVKVGEFETPVWIQQRIVTSEYASPLNYSGCGHCSTAMALNLRGQSVAPWDEFARCVELFGEMSVSPSGNKQYPFLSVVGMVKVLTSYGLIAKAYGVNNGDRKTAT